MSIGSAVVHVTCDHCTRYDGNDATVIDLMPLARRGEWDERDVRGKLLRDGWEVDASGMCTCPECIEDAAEDEEGESA